MNLKRFSARTSREALALVRQEFGDDAVVMSTRPCPGGVEVLAMAPESLQQIERLGASAAVISAAPARPAPTHPPAPAPVPAAPPPSGALRRLAAAAGAHAAGVPDAGRPASQPPRSSRPSPRLEPTLDSVPAADDGVAQDVAQLEMSTLSFQEFVRERMLKRRQAELQAEAVAAPAAAPAASVVAPIEAARARLTVAQRAAAAPSEPPVLREEILPAGLHPAQTVQTARLAPEARAEAAAPAHNPAVAVSRAAMATSTRAPQPMPQSGPHTLPQAIGVRLAAATAEIGAPEQTAMMSELRSMRGLIEQRFSALAFMEKMQRQPRQAALSQRLLDGGFSPALIRRMVESLPNDIDEGSWAAGVLERNLATAEREPALEDVGGVYALIGSTGVGKTTSTAKLAAAFATQHGAANLGLITLDAYRVAAHEQLRAYGRILGVPVHTAHDRASLEDLLELLAGKRMVLIDTAGMAQRDSRTRELLEMLSHRAIQRLLVINASAQGETIEDQLQAWAAGGCRGVILSKLDEAVKLGPALDAMIRHKLRVLAVANGQRVPEDWHRLGAHSLVQRALKSAAAPAWRVDDSDVNLIFAAMPASSAPAGLAALHG